MNFFFHLDFTSTSTFIEGCEKPCDIDCKLSNEIDYDSCGECSGSCFGLGTVLGKMTCKPKTLVDPKNSGKPWFVAFPVSYIYIINSHYS